MDDRLINVVNTLICSQYQYWGEFSLFINFQESKSISTAGVTIKNCSPHYYYNPNFLDKLNEKQTMFLHIHELFHLICDHIQRTGKHDRKLSNIAQDMIINDSIVEALPTSMVEKPSCGVLFTPKEYKGQPIYEELYEWLSKEYDEWKKKNSGKKKIKVKIDKNGKVQDPDDGQNDDGEKQDKNDNQKKDSDGSGKDPTLDEIFEGLEDYEFDFHFDENIDPELRKQIIQDITNNLKMRGFETSDVTKVLDKLTRCKKDHLKDIIRSISMIKGHIKKKSYKRPSRKGMSCLKGKVKYGTALNVILDVSGSMNGYIEKVLSVIFRDGININLLQCDTEVKCVEEVSSRMELQKVRITGLGGTIIQPAIDKVVEKYNKVNTVILTDGVTDDLNVSHLKKCLIISCQTLPKITGKHRSVILEN